eukprot:7857987-Alexandrium_andersonii.AAC.2
MPRLLLQPGAVRFNAAISACEQGGQWQAALALLSSMPDLRLLLSIITGSAAVSACSEGSSGTAFALFGGLPSLRPAPNI